ncbi:nuclear transport factor 2 family protein [Flavobacterium poyangense]|uniref:nuclear transport factor 2 family protein n=1 Tax=Flavobacterium poyangense TaxID=2204302 RepID=UPI001424135D|nr:nuclear transport factor 2 family protein [Flavobacterium sp. JXAS1]
MIDRENLIANYIEGYNQFDIDKMMIDFDKTIVFENVQNNEVNMILTGLEEFRNQAEEAKKYFSKRRQVITTFTHSENVTEIEIDYHAVLGMDFPNGMKTGQELSLKGKSIFEFLDNKIVRLTDVS